MRLVLIAILVSVLLTVLLFGLAGFLSGACHCETPTAVLFPYAAILLSGPNWESLSVLAIAVQFPLYSLVVILARGDGRKSLASVILLVFHVIAVIVAMRVNHQ